MRQFLRRVTDALLVVLAVLCIVSLAGMPQARADAPACRYLLAPTLLSLSAQQTPHVILAPAERDRFVRALEDRIGFRFPPVRNVLIAQVQGVIIYRLEINGCLTAPQALTAAKPVKRSGATPAGVFA